MIRFTIRDVLWLMALVAVFLGWWRHAELLKSSALKREAALEKELLSKDSEWAILDLTASFLQMKLDWVLENYDPQGARREAAIEELKRDVKGAIALRDNYAAHREQLRKGQ